MSLAKNNLDSDENNKANEVLWLLATQMAKVAKEPTGIEPPPFYGQSSIRKSHLTDTRFGYDFVVATTAASINATMKQFLDKVEEPLITKCYIEDRHGNPEYIEYETLKANAKGSDPFSVSPDADPTTDPDLINLYKARFLMGFRARLGIPIFFDVTTLPNLIELGSDTSQVIFRMMCSEFTVLELKATRDGTKWTSLSQPYEAPWFFTSKVDLRLSKLPADQTAYSKLPTSVQSAIQNLSPNTFSVQQLLFDLNNAGLSDIPVISGVEPGSPLRTLLEQVFVDAYFTKMKKNGSPLLACAITQNHAPDGSLKLTSFNFESCPYLDSYGNMIPSPTTEDQKLATLCYLCATDNHQLPPAIKFPWNWVDANELSDHHGVISINRKTLASHFQKLFADEVSRHCYSVHVTATLCGFMDSSCEYKAEFFSNQTPTITMPDSGNVLLQYNYSCESSDLAGPDGAPAGKIAMRTSYVLAIGCTDNQVIVFQRLVYWGHLQRYSTGDSGNIVDTGLIEVYNLGINAQGHLELVLSLSSPMDNKRDLSVNGFEDFFTGFNDLAKTIQQGIRKFPGGDLDKQIISAGIRNFIFPGGQVFTFKKAGFSNNLDLVSFITYVDPTGV